MKRRGRPSKPFDQEAYDSWRSRIPFSNEAIAAALELHANDLEEIHGRTGIVSEYWRRRSADVRSGRLSGKDLAKALPYLVTKCALCGATALYRYGTEGRCKSHRHLAPAFFTAKLGSLEAQRAAVEKEWRDNDARAKRSNNFRTFMTHRRNRTKERGL